ncbi:hypothetical protein IFM89_030426 [Coptis chinensis]|uniref:Myb/SANT-like domain-containing protein n=1 Tax=Coptis chinensis TaxID=261450 RepID=A0A835HZ03_9MAGN|nr:hypothetical protein IFM89_030426 [Coptis chinensis]
MDNVLLGTLVEATRDGKKCGMNKWQDSVWKSMRPALLEIAEEEVQQSHIDNRLRQMKLEYRNFLSSKEGAGSLLYQPIKQELEASNDYWREIMKNEKESKKFKALRDRGIKWDFEKLTIVMGQSHSIGSFALNGMDDINSNTIED